MIPSDGDNIGGNEDISNNHDDKEYIKIDDEKD